MRTFEDALRVLAEREPEKFRYREGIGEYCDIFDWADLHFPHSLNDITQDDIDEILALVGWEYEVHKGDYPDWTWAAWRYSDGKKQFARHREKVGSPFYPTKLEAAKSALIAVVGRLYKEE